MSGVMIENTVKFCFPKSAARPTWKEIAGFLGKLQSSVMEMETVYKMGDDRSLCIKYKTAVAMKEALEKNSDIVQFVYSNGKTVDVRMVPAGVSIQYVRVFDIPPEVTDKDLSAVFSKYGKIDRMLREKFPPDLGVDHMFTGVRGIYMVIEEKIPSVIDVDQWKGKVFYEDLRNKCFLCQSEGHRKNACPKRNSRNQEGNELEKSPKSYAGIVTQGAAVDQESIIVEEDVIEVVETEAEVEVTRAPDKPVVVETVYQSRNERELAENWAKHEAERRRRQEEYRKNEKSMQRRYKEDQEAREKAQKDHWEKCEAEKRSRQEKYKREMQVQSPPKKNSRIE